MISQCGMKEDSEGVFQGNSARLYFSAQYFGLIINNFVYAKKTKSQLAKDDQRSNWQRCRGAGKNLPEPWRQHRNISPPSPPLLETREIQMRASVEPYSFLSRELPAASLRAWFRPPRELQAAIERTSIVSRQAARELHRF